MDCPKCGHQQTDTVKCASCGVYFAKFAQQQELIANRSGAAHDELPDSGFGWSALALTAILSMALAWYVLRGHATSPATPVPPASAASGAAQIGAAPPAPSAPSAPSAARPFPHALRGLEAQLAVRMHPAISEKVAGAGRSRFPAMVVHGTESTSLHPHYADNRDLAIFQLPADHCPHLEPGSSDTLAQGERLYTIGNPSGLAYSVTSGVFSGDRGAGHERFLQTDAPINPGNSGGPLIRENGEVVGINTLVLQGAQGIGFAIPIEAVYQEFLQLRLPPH